MEFLDGFNSVISRWMGAKQKLHICGSDISVLPHYLSISYYEHDTLTAEIINGVLMNDITSELIQGYSIRGLVGDKRQGYGLSVVSNDTIPRDIEVINDFLPRSLDMLLKTSLSNYLSLMSRTTVYENTNGFKGLSDEPSVRYIESQPEIIMMPESLIEDMEYITKEISRDKRVAKCRFALASNLKSRRFVDSETRSIRDYSLLNNFSIDLVISHKDNFDIVTSLSTILHSWDDDSIQDLIDKVSCEIEELYDADIAQSGEYPAIFNPELSGVSFHEGLGGHLLSGNHVVSNTSTTFKDSLGKHILPEFISVEDDPTIKDSLGHYRYDDEGIKGKRVVLVKDGVHTNFLLDRDSAYKMDTRSNGHGRMGWIERYDPVLGRNIPVYPESRVSNLIVKSNKSYSDEEMFEHLRRNIKNSSYGIYVCGGSGSVDIETSEFHLYPDKAYKILKNGNKKRILGLFIPAKPYELLKQIEFTGQKLGHHIGFCGADSGDVPSESISPALYFPRVSIQVDIPENYTKNLLD